jgi:hypothetical protein
VIKLWRCPHPCWQQPCPGDRSQQPEFSLAQAVPRLQHLEVTAVDGQSLPTCQAVVQGHPAISALVLQLNPGAPNRRLSADSAGQLAALLQSLLQSLSSLIRLRLYVGAARDAGHHNYGRCRQQQCRGCAGQWRRERALAACPTAGARRRVRSAAGAAPGYVGRGAWVGAADPAALLDGGLPCSALLWLLRADVNELGPSADDTNTALLRWARGIAGSGGLVQALAAAVGLPSGQQQPAGARAAEPALGAGYEQLVQAAEASLLRGAASSKPLLPQEEAEAVVRQQRRQLALRGRLAPQLQGSGWAGPGAACSGAAPW